MTDNKRKVLRPTVGRGKRTPKETPLSLEDVRIEVEAESALSTPKSREADAVRRQDIRTEVKEISVAKLAQDIGSLGVDIADCLAKITGQMQDQVRLLETLREAVDIETKELERLHRIDVVTTELDSVIRDHDVKKSALQREIDEQRKVWEEENAVRDWEIKDAEQALRRQRGREQDEYEYQKNIERKKVQDEFELKVRDQERKINDRNEEMNKVWSQREEALNERESELASLRQEVEKFPERLKKEIDAAVSVTTQRLVAQHKQDSLVAQKDWDAERKVATLQIKTLGDAVERQLVQIEHLQSRLEDSKKQVQDIAVKAIEGASGARALTHVSQIAMEQAKPRSPQP